MKLLSSLLAVAGLALSGCAPMVANTDGLAGVPSTLMPRTSTYSDLINLPKPAGRIPVAIYDFRDQTGQYRPAPASTFSTAVTQGGAAMLSAALADSGWFIPLERVGLQNLLTERKIIRANLERTGRSNDLEALQAANLLFEGGIIAFDSNVRTGGSGAEYFGIGASGQYQVDQVTINLRAVDITTGQVIANVNTSKTIFSRELRAGVYRFIDFKRLLEVETGYTNNEPVQLAVMSAIESAVIHLIAQGVDRQLWALANPAEMQQSELMDYLQAPTPML
ncbi:MULTISPECIES: CsgG/HfaB family protein [Cobetia]|uniref:Curli production assembly/transport component CsgG n=1 Tax=Cobetia crustatorum TaxID=553385 RepID=A0A558HS31_9GAMM|nr:MULTISPECIES: CsgG/HfaB family protein [Cobetia]TVU71940.1 curli production assembly/transport protein CsgG [Cobetia crustatorum]